MPYIKASATQVTIYAHKEISTGGSTAERMCCTPDEVDILRICVPPPRFSVPLPSWHPKEKGNSF